MSETFTFDASQGESEGLSAEEQDSLAVGEALQAEHEAKFAGKFSDAQQLEKAYLELQQKLGQGDDEAEDGEEVEEEYEETEEEEESYEALVSDFILEANQEWAENGELSAETMEAFAEMDSSDLVNAYVAMQAEGGIPAATADLSEAEVGSIKDSIGGDEQYAAVTEWAAENLAPETINSFDRILEVGDTEMIALAVQGLNSMYEANMGSEGRMMTGGAAENRADVFRSQQELVNAMADPRYDQDPGYRMDIMDKLERSDISF